MQHFSANPPDYPAPSDPVPQLDPHTRARLSASEDEAEAYTWLRTADAYAWHAAGRTAPNPAVGCILRTRSGATYSGYTQPPGGAHAEVMALRAAAAAGDSTTGATAYVTLEPCNHTGRTGPCAEALLTAGISQLHYAFADPYAPAAGGANRLRAAGVLVNGPYFPHLTRIPTATPIFAVEAWLRAHTQQRPSITIKTASTLDGFAAATDSTSQWITGKPARLDVHADRRRRDAILVGTGTILADNPRLTARDSAGNTLPAAAQPLRVVIGTRDITGAQIFNQVGETLWLRTHDLAAVMSQLYQRGIVDCLVEGGPQLAQSFLTAGYVDELLCYQAPSLLSNGQRSWVGTPQHATTISQQQRWITREVQLLGSDVKWRMTRSPTTEDAAG